MKMSEAFDKIRRELSTSRAAWYPQKWTTMVEGRPVQMQPCILPYNPLAEPDVRRAKCHGHGGVGRPPSQNKVFSQKPACQKQSLFMSCRCHENTFACPCQGHFWHQVFMEYLDPQALVLSHEGASPVEQLPYLAVVFATTPDVGATCATT